MPNRCFVPNCKAGYLGLKPSCKLSLFAPPKDEALFKQWEQYIPRKDTKLKPSSSVCSGHFKEDDIFKGRMLKEKDRKEIFPCVEQLDPLKKEQFQEFFKVSIYIYFSKIINPILQLILINVT